MIEYRSGFHVDQQWKKGLPFAMISASRVQHDAVKNKALTASLKADLAAYKPIATTGKGQETDRRTGQVYPALEASFFVPLPSGERFQAFKQHMLELGAKYGQNWVLIGNGKVAHGYDEQGNIIATFNKLVFGVEDAEEIWSKLKGVNFRFEEGVTTAGRLLELLDRVDES